MMLARRRSFAFLIAGAALFASPAYSAVGTLPTIATPMDDAETRALMASAIAAAEAQDCPRLLGLLDPALPRLTGRNRNAAQLLRIPCLLSAGRTRDVTEVYGELVASDPHSPLIRSIGVVVAVASNDAIEASRRMADLADEDPAALARLTGVVARGIIQTLTEREAFAERDRLFIALARADWQPEDRPEMRDGLAQGAIDALISARRTDEARALLPRVQAPELLAGMAMERQYEPLWPTIEARLGAGGGLAVDRFAAARLDGFANAPDDPDARRDAARAFLLLGRFPEVGEVAAPVRIVATMGEADVVTVRYDAQALAAQGRIDEAAARLRPFTTMDLARTPIAASGLVSLAELLDENKREEEALTVARDALARGGDALSGWGVGWLKRTEVCALAGLGRAAEARRLGDALKADARRNEPAAIEALLCLGRDDEAASLATKTLATSEGAGKLADQFQPEGALWAASASRLRALWMPLRARADVKAAFDKAARILPETLWPARTPRPIPRVTRPDDVPVT